MKDKLEATLAAVLVTAGAIALSIYGAVLAGGDSHRRLKYPGSFEEEVVTWHVHAHPVVGGFLMAAGILAAIASLGWGIYVVARP